MTPEQFLKEKYDFEANELPMMKIIMKEYFEARLKSILQKPECPTGPDNDPVYQLGWDGCWNAFLDHIQQS